jgi:hypothetical protein
METSRSLCFRDNSMRLRRLLITFTCLSFVGTADALNIGVARRGAANNRAWKEFMRDMELSPCRLGVDVRARIRLSFDLSAWPTLTDLPFRIRRFIVAVPTHSPDGSNLVSVVQVEVRPSKYGNGLFALRTIEKGQLIERYTGKFMSGEEFETCESNGHYATVLASGDVIDGADPSRSNFVRYINHSVRKANCETCNMIDEENDVYAVYVEAKRRIEGGTELLMSYGDEYWDNMGLKRWSPERWVVDYF